MIWKIRMSQKEDCQKYKYSININFVKRKHFPLIFWSNKKYLIQEFKNMRFLITWLQTFFWKDCWRNHCSERLLQLVEDKSLSKDGVVRRCTKRYKKKVSIRKGSWMSASLHVLLRQFIKLTVVSTIVQSTYM